jgi:tellurite resistance protein TehA-like permease
MGTGIVSILLHALPYTKSSTVLYTLSIVIFILNVILFCLILGADVVRYILYPKTWTLMIRHPVQSLFLGTLPMGFATIITMGALVCAPKWGGPWPNILWALWWLDAIVSLAVCMGLPFVM